MDNDATNAATFSSREPGANPDITATRGSYLPGYSWSDQPQVLVKSSDYSGDLPWVTLNALTSTAREYPTQTTMSETHGLGQAGVNLGDGGDDIEHWRIGTLNGNADNGVISWTVVRQHGEIGSFYVGGGQRATAMCNYKFGGSDSSGLGTCEYCGTPSTASTCSTWVR